MGNDPRNKESHTPCLIKRFAVDKLFGTNSYDFMVPMTTDSESGKLLRRYGDKGSGKTTMLNL